MWILFGIIREKFVFIKDLPEEVKTAYNEIKKLATG
jgi:hypothetical protein